ncbi:hypothetical protein N5E86_15835 [Stutzerimonas stutzeri]|uniref:hypothetical protein n=1 Tax=Stutzerimonas stutzeri TaxID=316 RepID=UPI00244BD860|nr:hypothetical protein [Stutzerimonas stutzeri]MDH1555924.1 hypothetical protein [Stutzerimonas stutzeri]
MNRPELCDISFVVDDALAERCLTDLVNHDYTLVGYQAGFEMLFVAVISCLPGCVVEPDEACEIATDLLLEKKWFADESQTEPSIVFPPVRSAA